MHIEHSSKNAACHAVQYARYQYDPGKFPGEGVHKSATVSDTVGLRYPDPAKQEHVICMFSNPSSVQAKNPEIVKNIVFTSFSPCFSTQVVFFAQPYQI